MQLTRQAFLTRRTLVIASLILLLLLSITTSHPFTNPTPPVKLIITPTSPSQPLPLPPHIRALHINIGPNTSPLLPPENDTSVAVLAIEPNTGIAHHLRESFQKTRYANRFFVINCAIAGRPLSGGIAALNFYNSNGQSSSLASARLGERSSFANRTLHSPSDRFGPGGWGVDFVPVVSLERVLSAFRMVRIELLKIDVQGFDLDVVKSARVESLRNVERIIAETYLEGVEGARYVGVRNDLKRDWVPFMEGAGFKLDNPTDERGKEYDAVWSRVDED